MVRISEILKCAATTPPFATLGHPSFAAQGGEIIVKQVYIDSNSLAGNKAVAYPFNSDDFEAGVFFEVAADLGDVNIEVATIEKRIVTPDMV